MREQPHHRGGMPLEVGPFTQLIGQNTSPALDRTVATDNRALFYIVTGGGVLTVMIFVRKWLEKHDRSRVRGEALRDLLGDSSEEKGKGKQRMLGSTVGSGLISSGSGSDTKAKPIGKRRQRALSKSSDSSKTSHQPMRISPKDLVITQLEVDETQPFISELKTWIPTISGVSSKVTRPNLMMDESTQTDNQSPISALEIQATVVPSEIPVMDPASTPSAAERKKAKKKQTRANRQRNQVIPDAPGESDALGSSTDAHGPINLDMSETSGDDHLETIARRDLQIGRDSMEWDTESITPTATAHTTPKARTRSRMGPPEQEQAPRSPISRTLSVASAEASTDERLHSSFDSAPSLIGTLSPKSSQGRSESVPSSHPVTPSTPHVGLNIHNADFESLDDQEHTIEWHEVGSGGKAKKKKRIGNVAHSSGNSSVSPPESSASPLSNGSSPLPNLEATSALTRSTGSSTSWMSDTHCPDCEQRRQQETENGVSQKTSDLPDHIATIAVLREQLEKAEMQEKRQRDLVKSLTATNTSLSERLNHLREEKHPSENDAGAAYEMIRKLEQELAYEREHMSVMTRRLEDTKRREKEQGREDWKKRHGSLLKEYNDHRSSSAQMAEEMSRNAARQEAQIIELSRMIEAFRLMQQQQLSPGMIAQNPVVSYQMPPMMMAPGNPALMSPGMAGMPGQYIQAYSVPSSASSAYSHLEASSRHVSPQRPPRHRYERNLPSGPIITADQAYSGVSSMWELGSSPATTSQAPSSPSRSSDISSSILKPRGSSAGGTSSRGSATEMSDMQTAPQLKEADDVVAQQETEGGPSLGALLAPPVNIQPAPFSTKPTETTSVTPGQTPPSLQENEAQPPFRDLEFMFTRTSPHDETGNSPEQPASAKDDLEKEFDPPISSEDDYDEPVFASIRQ